MTGKEPPQFYLNLYARYVDALDFANKAMKESHGAQWAYELFRAVRLYRSCLNALREELKQQGYTNLP